MQHRYPVGYPGREDWDEGAVVEAVGSWSQGFVSRDTEQGL